MVRKRLPSFIFPPNPGLPGLSDFEFVFKSLGANLTAAAQLHDSLIKIQAVTYSLELCCNQTGDLYAARRYERARFYREVIATRLAGLFTQSRDRWVSGSEASPQNREEHPSFPSTLSLASV